MLEKQKEWCQNKVEKGKKWVKDHKFGIGCVAGKDGFGRESYHSPWVRYEYGEEDKERINKAITAAINRDEPCEF